MIKKSFSFLIIGKTNSTDKTPKYRNRCIKDGVDFKALYKKVKKMNPGDEIQVKDEKWIAKDEFYAYRWLRKDARGKTIWHSRRVLHVFSAIHLMYEYDYYSDYDFESDECYHEYWLGRMVKYHKAGIY